MYIMMIEVLRIVEPTVGGGRYTLMVYYHMMMMSMVMMMMIENGFEIISSIMNVVVIMKHQEVHH